MNFLSKDLFIASELLPAEDAGLDSMRRTGPAFQVAANIAQSSDCAFCFDVKCVKRMAAGHIQTIALRTAEAQVRATLGQLDETDGLALRIEHLDAIKFFRLAVGRARAAPSA